MFSIVFSISLTQWAVQCVQLCLSSVKQNEFSLQEGALQQMNRKVFIGRCTDDMTADDLRSYFSKFGEVVDVFIPKPFRAFAFVTFADPEVAQNLCGEDHIIKNASVHVSNAAPKSFDKHDKGKMGMVGGGSGGGNQGFGGQGGGGGWGNPGRSNHHMGGGVGNMGSQGGNMGGGGQGQGNMNSPNLMGLGNLGAAFQLNPAMVAAAQAALTQGGWGMLGMNNQQGGSGAGGNNGGGDNSGNSASNPGGFGNIGSGGSNTPVGNQSSSGGFLGGGWNGAPGTDSTQSSTWGQQKPQSNSGWGN